MVWKGKGQVTLSERGLDAHMRENIPVLSSFAWGIMLLKGQICPCVGKMRCRTLRCLIRCTCLRGWERKEDHVLLVW